EFDQSAQETLPRKYFAGGIEGLDGAQVTFDRASLNEILIRTKENLTRFAYRFAIAGKGVLKQVTGGMVTHDALAENREISSLKAIISSRESPVKIKRAAYSKLCRIDRKEFGGAKYLIPLTSVIFMAALALPPLSAPWGIVVISGVMGARAGLVLRWAMYKGTYWDRLANEPPEMVWGETFFEESLALQEMIAAFRDVYYASELEELAYLGGVTSFWVMTNFGGWNVESALNVSVNIFNMFLREGYAPGYALHEVQQIFHGFSNFINFIDGAKSVALMKIISPSRETQELVREVFALKARFATWKEIEEFLSAKHDHRMSQEVNENIDNTEIVRRSSGYGGIDLGQGNYLKVIGADAARMLQFDPRQIHAFQKDFCGLTPLLEGVPTPVDWRAFVG
ncbi:MAG: hypothetical protein WCI27_08965, partial [Candidatus Omnitrophota bacterium]